MTKREVTQLSYEITGLAIKVHKILGPGLLESIYERCLKYELEKNGYTVSQQFVLSVMYDDLEMDLDLPPDLFVNKCVVIEIKAISNILPVHQAQLQTYRKLLNAPQGLLINFFTDNITKSIVPIVNEYFKILPDE
ncbi:GxxExxY protein [Pedobacter sp. AK013]|uniref:GxxExxY protein n=1 Tax=Pedobacter sp. AK013 TaxID=2723071 RepID=UPI0016188B76|nr:GxxExxY protein [Pedobacter sp. AK013]MBB6236745.1 GxxExxY protein [Pedobacter sp. AK013]